VFVVIGHDLFENTFKVLLVQNEQPVACYHRRAPIISRMDHRITHMRFIGLVIRPTLCVVGGLCLLLIGSTAAAQTTVRRDRGFLSLHVTSKATTSTFDENLAPIIYAERAVLATTHPGEHDRLAFEPGGGIRIWRNLGAGAALTRRSVVDTTSVRALVPHPVLFNQPRVATKAGTFGRSDTAVHVQALLMLPIHNRFDVTVSVGPSFVTVRQDILRAIEVAETGAPFTTVGIGNVAVITREVSTLGLNTGADVTWLLTSVVGIGVTTRYVRGYADTTLVDGRPVALEVGGLQIGVGARLRLR